MDSLLSGQLFRNFIRSLETAGRIINVDPNIVERLKKPRRCIVVSVPVRMDDYSVKVFDGYRVQYNSTLGPFKGGMRYHESVNLSEVAGLAGLMVFKNSLMGLPLGGAKGGVNVDPTKLSKTEKQNLTRRYTSELSPFIGPNKDIPAPDVGTDSQTMAWVMDTFSQEHGFAQPGVVTGKPIEIGGSYGRTGATGLGVVFITERALELTGKSMKGARIAVQGFGNVGSHAAQYAHQLGAKVVAVSDVSCGIFNPEGLNIPEVMEYMATNKILKGYPNGQEISNEDLLALDVDALLPCALDGVINSKNVENIKAPLVIEGANGPVTMNASQRLSERGIVVVPDIVANAGGVVVSYFEWVQDITFLFWGEEEINARLKQIITRAFDNVWQFHKEREGIELRTAAMAVSLQRLEKAMLLRGLYPR